MHGNATCAHCNTPDRITIKLRLPDSETGNCTICDARLTVTPRARPGRLQNAPVSAASYVLPRVLVKRATVQVPGADPPGGTQGSLSPRGGLIMPVWRCER